MRKKLIVWLGILIIVGMCLFPPWVITTTHSFQGGLVKVTKPLLRYGFLLYPPELETTSPYSLSIDFQRLGLQCGIVILIISGFCIMWFVFYIDPP